MRPAPPPPAQHTWGAVHGVAAQGTIPVPGVEPGGRIDPPSAPPLLPLPLLLLPPLLPLLPPLPLPLPLPAPSVLPSGVGLFAVPPPQAATSTTPSDTRTKQDWRFMIFPPSHGPIPNARTHTSLGKRLAEVQSRGYLADNK
jgi:hypothetical protein